MRKTVDIATVVKKANHMLADSVDEKKEGREGIIQLLTSVLHDTDTYAGFQYLKSGGPERKGEVDDTRRRYNLHGSLT